MAITNKQMHLLYTTVRNSGVVFITMPGTDRFSDLLELARVGLVTLEVRAYDSGSTQVFAVEPTVLAAGKTVLSVSPFADALAGAL